MSIKTAEEITNLYLYGTTTLPADLTDESLIRPKNTAPLEISVNGNDFMQTGPGRIALPVLWDVVNQFFDLNRGLQPGTYTEQQLRTMFGISKDDGVQTLQQYNYDDGLDNYAERFYIWNSGSYEIDDSAVFLVDENGNRHIEHFAVKPLGKLNGPKGSNGGILDNFDFEGGGLAKYLNGALEAMVDPSGLGIKVNIEITNVTSFRSYTIADFAADTQKYNAYHVGTVTALARMATEGYDLVTRLFDNGSIKFLDEDNKPILYGSDEDDIISGTLSKPYKDGTSANIAAELHPLSGWVHNGIHYIGGVGNDVLFGTEHDDKLVGGDDNDTLQGLGGNDQMEGGSGHDTYTVGNGDTLLDTDGQGEVWLDGQQLRGGSGPKGEVKDAQGNTYHLFGSTLAIRAADGSAIIIKGFENNDLQIYLDEKEDGGDGDDGEPTDPLPPDAPNIVSPIVLDLDGDGLVTSGLPEGVFFDHGGDGFAERGGWVGRVDGLLACDRDGDGRIGSGRELFGSETLLADGQKAANGYIALAELDSNGDGQIDAEDPAYAQLRVWQDRNGDAVSQPDELLALAAAQVRSIGIRYTDSTRADHGNLLKQLGGYVRSDGSPGATADIWFATDPAETLATESLPETPDIAVLPDLAGFRQVHSLHQAMLRDASGQLQALVRQFEDAPPTARHGLVNPIIYKWLGIEDPAYRGPFMDAYKLAALETFTGAPYAQRGSRDGSVWPNATKYLTGVFDKITDILYNQLMESHFKPLLDTVDISWDTVNGRFDVDVGETVASLKTVFEQHPYAADEIKAFGQVLASHGSLGQQVISAIQAKADSLLSQGLLLLLANLDEQAVIIGSEGDDSLMGSPANNFLFGRGGADYLSGGAGNDVLEGNTGNDVLIGGQGDDSYVFGFGDGQDTVFDFEGAAITANADSLHFGPGINPADVQLSRDGYDLTFHLNGTADQVTLQNFGGGLGYRIESVVFADGTHWDADYLYTPFIGEWLVGTGADDYLVTWYGDAGHLQGMGGDDSLFGYNRDDHLEGGDGEDQLFGGEGDDLLIGGLGSDHLIGEDGNDYLVGGDGSNDLQGGAGDDVLEGGGDADNMTGDDGNDRLLGGDGSNHLQGGAGDDVLEGGADADLMTGEDGNDYLVGGDSSNELQGGAGDDVLEGGADADLMTGGDGNDRLLGGDGSNDLQGGAGDDVLEGGADADLMTGGDGNDRLLGGDGSNDLQGGAGDDALEGGADADLMTGDDGNDRLLGGNGSNELYGGAGNDELDGGVDVDILVGASGNDILVSRDGNDLLLGGEGSDRLYGGSGRDILYGENQASSYLRDGDYLDGGEGADIMYESSGDDTYIVDNLDDIIINVFDSAHIDFSEDDLVYASVSYTLPEFAPSIFVTGIEHLILTGSSPIDATGNGLNNQLVGNSADNHIEGLKGDDTLSGHEGNDMLFGGQGDDIVSGGVGDDRLYGNDENDRLTGDEGDDILDGGYGADTLSGGLGNDSYWVDSPDDFIFENEGEGIDKVFSWLSYQLGGTVEQLELLGSAKDAIGNDLANIIIGSGAANFIDGGTGADSLSGGYGNDTYLVDDANDAVIEQADEGEADEVQTSLSYTLTAYVEVLTLLGEDGIRGTGNTSDNQIVGNAAANALFGLAGSDRLLGGSGDDDLNGGDGDDLIFGETDNDVLNGGQGHDVLEGGLGNDYMMGDAGNDSYWVDSSADTIVEQENAGQDTVYAEISYQLGGHLENLALIGWQPLAGSGNGLDNVLQGNDADNRLYGLDGHDRLDGGYGQDWLVGGAGNDTYVADNADDQVEELADGGVDNVQAAGDFTLPAFVENLQLLGDFSQGEVWQAYTRGEGNALDNGLLGSDGENYLAGHDGQDRIDARAGSDEVSGGGGDDWLYGGDDAYYSWYIDLGWAGGYGGTYLAANADAIYGGAGNDQIDGGSGHDSLYGDEGDDIIYGGNDGLTLPEAEIIGGAYSGGYGGGTLGNNDSLDGGAGDDQLDGGTGDDWLYGGEGSDFLYGGGDGNLDTANNDWLDGGTGLDIMQGGSGDDTYFVDGTSEIRVPVTFTDCHVGSGDDDPGPSLACTADTVIEQDGQGYDIIYSSVSLALPDFVEALYFEGEANIDVIGNSDANFIAGNAGNNRLDGGQGVDYLAGGLGDDVYFVDNDADVVDEHFGQGQDTVRSYLDSYGLGDYVENLDLVGPALNGYGNALNNRMRGNAMDNRLEAGEGDDLLTGAGGNDTLFGGLGNDSYVFALGFGQDIAIDAGGGQDSVRMNDHLTVQDITLTQAGQDVVVGIKGSQDRLVLADWFDPGQCIESILFCDGTTLGIEAILNAVANQPPVAQADFLAIQEDAQDALAGNVLANDSDPNMEDVLTVAQPYGASGEFGLFQLTENGQYRYQLDNQNTAVQALGQGDSLTERFLYTVQDNHPYQSLTASGEVTVTILGANDAPIANPETLSLQEDVILAGNGNVLANDYDLDTDAVLSVLAPGLFVGSYGELALQSDGSYRYGLDNNALAVQSLAAWTTVSETFSYSVTDGLANSAGEIRIQVTGSNDAPVVANPLADQTAQTGSALTLTIPSNTFADIDQGDQLALSATLADGTALPSWLGFDAITGQLMGTPNQAGAWQIAVTATDWGGLVATDAFNLTVNTPEPPATGPGVGTIGFWKQWTSVWDGNPCNDGKFSGNAHFPKADILYHVVDPHACGQSAKGLLIGDWNRNGNTDTGEQTLFYSVAEAQKILSASNQDARYLLGKQLVASWLNVIAGNRHDKIATDVDNAVQWLQKHSPDEGGSSLGDGSLVLASSKFKVLASSPDWQGAGQGEAVKNVLDYYNNTGAGFAIDRDTGQVGGSELVLVGLQAYQADFA